MIIVCTTGQLKSITSSIIKKDLNLYKGNEAEVLVFQSEEAVIYPNQSESQHENVKFSDTDPGFSYDLDDYVDPTRMMQDSDDAELGNFFSRPLKIAEYTWGLGITFSQQFNPWELYFNNTRVLNRISNYKLLRCKLRVKILINGTPFHYGRIMAGYNPLDAFDEAETFTAFITQDLVQLSQRPHLFLNPTTSEGGEMELPFFWHLNYLDIPSEDWKNMGQMYLRTINNLVHANGGDTPVTISVFAWATDVSLSVPTSVEPNTLQPQASEKKISQKGGSSKNKTTMKARSKPKTSVSAPQEHKEANTAGMISGPATAVAKAAGALKMIPMLTPYATAAEFAAGKTAAIAKLFGYSRPAVTRDPEPYKPVATSSLALTTVPDMVNKMTIDDQQNLSIDTRIAGVGSEDTLAIKGIAGREAYLTTFNWNTTDIPESLLWNSRVSPSLWAESGTGVSTAHHFPPLCMASLPFKYWTGSIKYRFQIVKSAYHRGRLKVVYDPSFFASNEYNTNYLEVIDISERDDFTITVGVAQNRTLLDKLDPGRDGVTEAYSTTLYNADNKGNGVLGLFVVNSLTAPDDVSGDQISVNVYVSAGDDFEVFVPEDKYMDFVPFDPANPLVGQATDETIEEKLEDSQGNEPLSTEESIIGPQLQYEDCINKVWTGESIQSFRPLLKRYFLWNALALGDIIDTVIAHRYPMFPYYRGRDPNGVHTTSNGNPYNYCNMGLVHWVTLAHQGWRGGMRYKLMQRGSWDYCNMSVQRSPIATFRNYDTSIFSPSNLTSSVAAAKDIVKDVTWGGNNLSAGFLGWAGQVWQKDTINPVLEFEVPFYHNYRFYPGKTFDYVSDGDKVERYDIRVIGKSSLSASLEHQCSCAEDFQVFFFTGLPRMYRESAPPT